MLMKAKEKILRNLRRILMCWKLYIASWRVQWSSNRCSGGRISFNDDRGTYTSCRHQWILFVLNRVGYLYFSYVSFYSKIK